MRLITFDTEFDTSDLAKSYKSTASSVFNPYHKDSRLVAVGWAWTVDFKDVCGETTCVDMSNSCFLNLGHIIKPLGYVTINLDEFSGEGPTVLCGQNLKIDLHNMGKPTGFSSSSVILKEGTRSYTIHEALTEGWAEGKFQVWDIQLAEYLLTGQRDKFIPLNKLIKRYLPDMDVKDSAVTELFASGVKASAIPEETLKAYLEHDVRTTHKIAKAQIMLAASRGKLDFIKDEMDSIVLAYHIEHNGMYVDPTKLVNYSTHVKSELTFLQGKIKEYLSAYFKTLVPSVFPNLPEAEEVAEWFNMGSLNQLRTLLEGGPIRNPRKRKEDKIYDLPEGVPVKIPSSLTRENLEKVLIEATATSGTSGTFGYLTAALELLLEVRKLKKLLSTYLEAYEAYLCIGSGMNLLRPTVQLVVTPSGRWSQVNPNLQNITQDERLRDCFVSRFGDDGCILKFDYKQVEIVAAAILSGDTKLLLELSTGIDIHDKMAELVYGPGFSQEQRKTIKSFNFGIIYGAGAVKLAETAGVSISKASLFLQKHRYEYPEFHAWLLRTYDKLKDSRVPIEGSTFAEGYLEGASPIGRFYTLQEKEKKLVLSYRQGFSWNEVANYPTQGFAFDLVKRGTVLALKNIIRSGLHSKIKLVNLVHDEPVFDCSLDLDSREFKQAVESIDFSLTVGVYDHLAEVYDYQLPVMLKVEHKAQKSWNGSI